MNRQGKMGVAADVLLARPSQSSGIAGHFTKRHTIRPAAMNSSATANTGYILPMILSIGSMVAMI